MGKVTLSWGGMGQHHPLCDDEAHSPAETMCVLRPSITCLCGSTKFKQAFERANLDETLAGRIVLTVGCFTHADNVFLTPDHKRDLDELHKRKIEMADEVLVLNVDGYIGVTRCPAPSRRTMIAPSETAARLIARVFRVETAWT